MKTTLTTWVLTSNEETHHIEILPQRKADKRKQNKKEDNFSPLYFIFFSISFLHGIQTILILLSSKFLGYEATPANLFDQQKPH